MLFAPELKEKDFIHEDPNPPKWWLWAAILLALLGIMWLGAAWLKIQFPQVSTTTQTATVTPFDEVTNRQFSLFLYQFPEYLPKGALDRSNYLPGMAHNAKFAVKRDDGDTLVQATPEALFMYHTWKRQISSFFSARTISTSEFREFLADAVIWDPKNWKEAPEGYIELIKQLPTMEEKDIQPLPDTSLPQMVRRAFQGWKNQNMESEAIKQQKITFSDMQEFLALYPNYARPLWRNINYDYLLTLSTGKFDPKTTIKDEELSTFLKIGFFNYINAKLGK